MSATPFERINFWVNFSHLNLLGASLQTCNELWSFRLTHSSQEYQSTDPFELLYILSQLAKHLSPNRTFFFVYNFRLEITFTTSGETQAAETLKVIRSKLQERLLATKVPLTFVDLGSPEGRAAGSLSGDPEGWFQKCETPIGCVGCQTSKLRGIPTRMEAKMRES